MKNQVNKSRRYHQIKTHWYYWFWGIATVAVVSGQIYIGTGYRKMSKSLDTMTGVFVHMIRLSK